MNSVNFFLGANTPDGFYSLFNELYNPYTDWNMYIIKGGPGTGKSTLMKSIAAVAENKGLFTENIYCSSDPKSLDGVIIPQLKVSVADGTSPHTIEPIFPGVCEHLVDLSSCWDTDKFKDNISKIKMMTMTNSAAHKKCIKYLKAAKLIDNEIKAITESATDTEKIIRFAERIADTYLKPYKNNNREVKNRFISVLSPEGLYFMKNTVDAYCEYTISINDNYAISYIIMNELSRIAYEKRINMILCRCPMNPKEKIEHIIFPDLKFGIFTSDSYNKIESYKTVNSSRFIDKNKLYKTKNSIAFLNKAKNEMLDEAVDSLKSAKSAHDILESYYIEAMDFNKVEKIKNNLIENIFG